MPSAYAEASVVSIGVRADGSLLPAPDQVGNGGSAVPFRVHQAAPLCSPVT
ncbi:MAG TPA: hypothetical protein VGD71_34230 [Kribbella sp.]